MLRGLRPAVEVIGEPVRWDLEQRMRVHHVVGVSIAVVDSGRVIWAQGFGVRRASTADSVRPTTLFQAASMSKPVAALAALRLVEDGRLALDADVNRSLTSWRLPENAFTRREPVTLRGLLSHTAGLTVHGFAGFADGERLPSLRDVLDGAPPAKNPPVRVDTLPGTRVRYSGGGYTIIQQLIEDVTRVPFTTFMERTVLTPLGMRRSTFAQPLPTALAADAAAGHDTAGRELPGHWHTYPMQAPAGLWTTPTDLAQVILEVQRSAAGTRGAVLGPKTMRQMLTPPIRRYGLGWALYPSGAAADLRFEHSGGNDGYAGYMAGLVAPQQGIVVLTNADQNGDELWLEVVRAFEAEFGWPSRFARTVQTVRLQPATLARLVGRYRLQKLPQFVAELTVQDGTVYLEIPGNLPRGRLFATSDSTFVPETGDIDLRVRSRGAAPVSEILLQGGAHPASRVPASP